MPGSATALHVCLLQDYYKAVMAEMYVDGSGMRHGGYRHGGGYGGGGYHQHGYQNGGGRGVEQAGNGGAGYEAGPSNVLRLRGLPFSAQKEDIVRWFEDVQIQPITPDR